MSNRPRHLRCSFSCYSCCTCWGGTSYFILLVLWVGKTYSSSAWVKPGQTKTYQLEYLNSHRHRLCTVFKRSKESNQVCVICNNNNHHNRQRSDLNEFRNDTSISLSYFLTLYWKTKLILVTVWWNKAKSMNFPQGKSICTTGQKPSHVFPYIMPLLTIPLQPHTHTDRHIATLVSPHNPSRSLLTLALWP